MNNINPVAAARGPAAAAAAANYPRLRRALDIITRILKYSLAAFCFYLLMVRLVEYDDRMYNKKRRRELAYWEPSYRDFFETDAFDMCLWVVFGGIFVEWVFEG